MNAAVRINARPSPRRPDGAFPARVRAPATGSGRTFAAVFVLGISVPPFRYSTFRFLQPSAATGLGVQVFRRGPASIPEFRALRT
jgi:hypothetical protein